MRVTVREKKLKQGRTSLYLDFYPAITVGNKQTRREYLKLYIYTKPSNEIERDHNKETKILADSIRSQRQLQLQANDYGFISHHNKNLSFIEYYEKNYKSRPIRDKSKESYQCALIYVKEFGGENINFGRITPDFCRQFKRFLEAHESLKINSAALYYSVFRIIVADAVKDKMLATSPTKGLGSISTEETKREFLTLEELKQLLATPYPNFEEMRQMAFFAAMSGLRYSDVEKLIWSEIQYSKSQGYYIRFKQQKTNGQETLNISEEAVEYLGERRGGTERIFKGNYQLYSTHIPKWVKLAGIDKHITFHCFRHTFATLQITLGTDLYTVSKMLGHKNLATTQIYAKIIDEKKKDAASKITLK